MPRSLRAPSCTLKVAADEQGVRRSNELTRENIEANALMRDTNDARGLSLDDPGQWQVRLSDPVSGCVSAFMVEVVP